MHTHGGMPKLPCRWELFSRNYECVQCQTWRSVSPRLSDALGLHDRSTAEPGGTSGRQQVRAPVAARAAGSSVARDAAEAQAYLTQKSFLP